MLIEKLAAGVVRVQTPIGPRYVMPSFLQRLYLLWMFRNFPILPHAVLSRRQQRMIDRMCSEQSFASMAYADGMDEAAGYRNRSSIGRRSDRILCRHGVRQRENRAWGRKLGSGLSSAHRTHADVSLRMRREYAFPPCARYLFYELMHLPAVMRYGGSSAFLAGACSQQSAAGCYNFCLSHPAIPHRGRVAQLAEQLTLNQ